MINIRNIWRTIICSALNDIILKEGISADKINEELIVIENPPRPELGDLAFPMFPYAGILRRSPQVIAESLKNVILGKSEIDAELFVQGPYLNVKLGMEKITADVIGDILASGSNYGNTDLLKNKKIMVEFSCPNTNKPLHLGHLRNDSLGFSLSRILEKNGADVRRVNLINDRGIHICKSMLAYLKFGNGATPSSEGVKSDHFVGKYYVKYQEWQNTDASAEEESRKMLSAWESGDPETISLWKKMNKWAIDGIEETYKKTGISFDDVYYESETYSEGKKEVIKGLNDGIFYKEEDGSIWIDLSNIKLDKKVLLRGDGTSLYLTQDIGTAIARHDDWPFDELIYVVMSEQIYHFKVLFHVLKCLGKTWSDNLYHLAYGMVALPDGRMKSREGVVVDGDDLFDELKGIAKKEIITKDRETEIDNIDDTSAKIALGALNYYLLQVTPLKDTIFNPAESISFTGNTGPYLQYMGARISSMLRKYEDSIEEFDNKEFNSALLVLEDERTLVKMLSGFPEIVEQAGRDRNPAVITGYLYDLSRTFSKYYHDSPILKNSDKNLTIARITLSSAILQVLKNSFYLVGIPFLEKM